MSPHDEPIPFGRAPLLSNSHTPSQSLLLFPQVRRAEAGPPTSGFVHLGHCIVVTQEDVYRASACVTRSTRDVGMVGSSSILRSGRDVVRAI